MVGRRAGGRGSGLGLPLACLSALTGCSSSRSLGHGVSIDRFTPEARLEAEFRDESFADGAAASTKETIFRENMKFHFDGSVYHPKLLTFGGVVDLGLEQREQEQRGAPTAIRSEDDNNRYDVYAALLREHPYSLRLFAQRSQARVRQSFFPTNDAVATRHGAMVSARDWVVPTQVEVSTYQFEGESGDLRREQRDTLNVTGSRNTDQFNVNYTVFAQEVDSELAGGRYDDFQALAGATWRFGGKLQNSFAIDGQQRKQTGDTENESANVGGRTRVQLAEDLDSRVGASFGRSKFGDMAESTTDRTDVFGELEHKLYDSLTTVVRGDYLEQSIGAGDLTRVGGSGRVGYRKKVPFGAVRAAYQVGRSRQDEEGRLGANITITDEPHIVVLGNPVILDNADVDGDNLLVTNASGAVVYSTPADYVVDRIGIRTRLSFPVGSQIQPGDTILVTYTFASSYNRAFETDSQFASFELLFGDAVSMEVHWSELSQELVAGVSDATLDRATEWGVDVRTKMLDQNFAIEWLDRDSLLTPYTRTRLSWYTWLPMSDSLSISTNASGYQTRFKDERLEERGLSGLVSLIWRPGDHLSLELRSEVRRSELRTEDGWGAFVDALVRYQFRKTSVDFSLLTGTEEWEFSSDRDVLRMLLTVTRRF